MTGDPDEKKDKPDKGDSAPKTDQLADDFVRRVKMERSEQQTSFDYRSASLRIHGPICGKCGREFYGKNLRQLTVHHKDGNHDNNPRDGSNWENLCVYCHEDAHSRELLADYVSGAKTEAGPQEKETADEQGKVTLGDLFKAASKKK